MTLAEGSREPAKRAAAGWLASLAVYREPRLIAVLLMGFSSGLPLALTAATLSFWLAEIGVSLTTIGLLQPRRHLLQPQVPVVAADRPAADPAGDRAARATARLGVGDPDPARPGDPRPRPHRPARRSCDDRPRGGARRLPVGQPGHRDRRLPHRAAAPRRTGRGRRGDAVGLSLRHARRGGGRAVRRQPLADGPSPTA